MVKDGRVEFLRRSGEHIRAVFARSQRIQGLKHIAGEGGKRLEPLRRGVLRHIHFSIIDKSNADKHRF